MAIWRKESRTDIRLIFIAQEKIQSVFLFFRLQNTLCILFDTEHARFNSCIALRNLACYKTKHIEPTQRRDLIRVLNRNLNKEYRFTLTYGGNSSRISAIKLVHLLSFIVFLSHSRYNIGFVKKKRPLL
jgi:hypothetical protein